MEAARSSEFEDTVCREELDWVARNARTSGRLIKARAFEICQSIREMSEHSRDVRAFERYRQSRDTGVGENSKCKNSKCLSEMHVKVSVRTRYMQTGGKH